MKKLLLAASVFLGCSFFTVFTYAQENEVVSCEQDFVDAHNYSDFAQACSGPNDCHVFQTCVGGVCVDRGSGGNRCNIDSDCGIGGRCVVGQCQ